METLEIVKKLMEEVSTHREELKRVKEAFERYRNFFENIPVGIYRSTPEGKILHANPAMGRIFGYESPEELMKAGSYALYLEPDQRKRLKKEADKKDINKFELQMKRKDGSKVWVRGTEKVVKDESGKVLYYDGFLEDITERKATEEMYRVIIENTHDGIYIYRGNKFLFVNKRLCEFLGYSEEELYNMDIFKLVNPEDRERLKDYGRRREKGEEVPSIYEARVLNKEGQVRTLEFAVSAINYGGKYAALGAVRDVTERKQLEKKLREEKDRAEKYLNIAGNVIVLLNTSGKVKLANKRACEVLGYTESEILGKNWFDNFILPEQRKEIREVFKKILSGEIESFEYYENPVLTRDGKIRMIKWHNSVIKNSKGKVLEILTSGNDITELKEKEEKLRASLREKEILLRELHHRVKNNLQIISSLLRLQARHTDDERVSRLLSESQHRINSISLIHEKFYRSESLAEIKLGEYTKSLINELFRSYGTDKNRVQVELRFKEILLPIDKAIPAGLIINELVSNVLSYAFPAGKKGKLEIGITSPEKKMVEITVRDNGVGIPDSVSFDSPSTLGFRLIKILVNDQLKGEIKLKRRGGTEFIIRFRR